MPAAPSNEPRSLTIQEVHDEFDKLLADRQHMGLRSLIGDATLEPRNPFQRTGRKPKRWVVAAFGILLLGFLIFGYFHLR